MARRWLAARHRRSPLSARRLLARGGLQPADVGARRTRSSMPPPAAPVGCFFRGPCGGCGRGPSTPGPPTLRLSLVGGSSQLLLSERRSLACPQVGTKTPASAARHSSRPWAGRLTAIRIECSAVYTLRCLHMARIMSRDNKRFVPHRFFLPIDCHCALSSLRCNRTHRFVICFGGPDFQASPGHGISPVVCLWAFSRSAAAGEWDRLGWWQRRRRGRRQPGCEDTGAAGRRDIETRSWGGLCVW